MEQAPDPVNGPWTEVPSAWVSSVPATTLNVGFNTVQVTIPNVQEAQRGAYRALVCRAEVYCAFSIPTYVVPMSALPVVTGNPTGLAVRIGERAAFTASSDPDCVPHPDWGWGAPQPNCTVQWQKQSVVRAAFGNSDWQPIAGANGNNLVIGSATADDHGYLFRAVFTNSFGSRATEPALLTVVSEFVAPTITGQPTDLTVAEGNTAVFVASVAGTPPFSYQWRKNGQNVAGANSPSLTLNVAGQNSVGGNTRSSAGRDRRA